MCMGRWHLLRKSSRSHRRGMAKPTSTLRTRETPETLPCGRLPSPGNPPGPPLNAPRTHQAEDAQVRLLSLSYPSSVKGGLPEEDIVSTNKVLLRVDQ